MNKLIAEIDDFMLREHSARSEWSPERHTALDTYSVIAYESASQRFLVEIRDGVPVIYSHHATIPIKGK